MTSSRPSGVPTCKKPEAQSLQGRGFMLVFCVFCLFLSGVYSFEGEGG